MNCKGCKHCKVEKYPLVYGGTGYFHYCEKHRKAWNVTIGHVYKRVCKGEDYEKKRNRRKSKRVLK